MRGADLPAPGTLIPTDDLVNHPETLGDYPLATRDGIAIMAWLLTASDTWHRLTRAQRQALTVEAGSPRPITKLTELGLWADGQLTAWGRFVRDSALNQLEPGAWSVDEAGNLQTRVPRHAE